VQGDPVAVRQEGLKDRCHDTGGIIVTERPPGGKADWLGDAKDIRGVLLFNVPLLGID
jgi:hypothetical protein